MMNHRETATDGVYQMILYNLLCFASVPVFIFGGAARKVAGINYHNPIVESRHEMAEEQKEPQGEAVQGQQVTKEPQQVTQVMKEPQQITTKNLKKVEAGKRLAANNHNTPGLGLRGRAKSFVTNFCDLPQFKLSTKIWHMYFASQQNSAGP